MGMEIGFGVPGCPVSSASYQLTIINPQRAFQGEAYQQMLNLNAVSTKKRCELERWQPNSLLRPRKRTENPTMVCMVFFLTAMGRSPWVGSLDLCSSLHTLQNLLGDRDGQNMGRITSHERALAARIQRKRVLHGAVDVAELPGIGSEAEDDCLPRVDVSFGEHKSSQE